MILRSVALHNIRSYKESVIELPEGTTLLSGDIGSGKSTILHAVEFALFGALRGILPGETLLRNGANEGSVQLCFTIDGKEVAIERTLKRTKQGIAQDEANMVLNGARQPLTATELKSKVLDLLGYPGDLLTKSKGLVYRYTVYTPQEDMKRIIFDDPEIRLNTLRRVFDIDKYRRVGEHAKVYARFLRETCRQREGQIADLDVKEGILSTRQEKSRALNLELEKSQKNLSFLRKATAEYAKTWQAFDAQVKKLLGLRQQLAVLESEQRNLILHRSNIQHEISLVQKNLMRARLGHLPVSGALGGAPRASFGGAAHASTGGDSHISTDAAPDAAPYRPDEESCLEEESNLISISLSETTARAVKAEASLKHTVQALGHALARQQHATSVSQRLATLSMCPTCQQTVSEDHKHHIRIQEQTIVLELKKEIEAHHTAIAELETNKGTLDEQIAHLRDQQGNLLARKARLAHYAELTAQEARLSSQLQDLESRISILTPKKSSLSHQIYTLEDAEREATAAHQALAIAQHAEREAAVVCARISAEHFAIDSSIAELKDEITAKKGIKEQLHRDLAILHWLDNGFAPLLSLMEQHVLARVYHQFNDAFTSWFATLIDDTLMTAKIDELFAPAVTQNGYDISPEHLSGGEKTSLALAFRLALNKVINDLHTSIRTRDLLILDEPTDGFSNEQLDRVRDVLAQLPIKQCILVSHEAKVESFVDHIISVKKEGHVSRVEGIP